MSDDAVELTKVLLGIRIKHGLIETTITGGTADWIAADILASDWWQGRAKRVQALEAAAAARSLGPRPTDEPGHERAYWLRQKMDAAIMHLRHIEDYSRSHWDEGIPPEGSFDEATADRARNIYEQITADLLEGKLDTPPITQRLSATEAERDRLLSLLRRVRPHIGDEYQRQWPEDDKFDKLMAEVRAALEGGE